MEGALLKRIRADQGVIDVAGTFNEKPAIDFDERKSDDESAFPAAIQSIVSPGKKYSQGGASSKRTSRMRWECFGLTSDDAFNLAQAIIAKAEQAETVGGVRFQEGFLSFERTFPVETVGDRKVFRRVIDMDITATF